MQPTCNGDLVTAIERLASARERDLPAVLLSELKTLERRRRRVIHRRNFVELEFVHACLCKRNEEKKGEERGGQHAERDRLWEHTQSTYSRLIRLN